MAKDTSAEQRIAQLEAENAALKAAHGNSRGPVHPAVEPAFMNGSVVAYEGAPHRVTGRSIDWDGNVTYTLRPVSGTVVHVFGPPNARQVERYDLDHDKARAELDGIRTYDLAHPDDAEPVFEVPEQAIEAFHAHDTSRYAVEADAVRHGRASTNDMPVVSEAASIVRE